MLHLLQMLLPPRKQLEYRLLCLFHRSLEELVCRPQRGKVQATWSKQHVPASKKPGVATSAMWAACTASVWLMDLSSKTSTLGCYGLIYRNMPKGWLLLPAAICPCPTDCSKFNCYEQIGFNVCIKHLSPRCQLSRQIHAQTQKLQGCKTQELHLNSVGSSRSKVESRTSNTKPAHNLKGV